MILALASDGADAGLTVHSKGSLWIVRFGAVSRELGTVEGLSLIAGM